jgi:alanine racemase
MVKAGAYGHGLVPLTTTLVEHADELGVATVDEGLQLRTLVNKKPVFVMSGEKDWDGPGVLEAIHEARLVPALSSVDELRMVVECWSRPTPVKIELKLDTGMGRLGIQEEDLDTLVSVVEGASNLEVVGILTHFACADEKDMAPTWKQEAQFRRMLAQLPATLVSGAAIHSCNSGALIRRALGDAGIGEGTHVVRPGVMLYGAAPSRFLHDTPPGARLTQVGRLTARVIELRTMAAGTTVGYGGTWKVEGSSPVRIAVLGFGYADGCSRRLGNRGRVLIRGASFPIVGRVSMDLISVLVNDRIQVGDEAVLLGSQRGELGADEIHAWEWAEVCETIPYEVWTGIGARVARVKVL